MAEYRELLMGVGKRKQKDIVLEGMAKEFKNLVTLDNNEDHNPDIIWDLKKHPLPFDDNYFDEIHAYDILEHLAVQGDYEFFFSEFSEYWRILKPGGYFLASVPSRESKWLWADPSHKRVIQSETLMFLDQDIYEELVGKAKMSDFRYLYKAHFKAVLARVEGDTFFFVLKAIK